MNSTDSVPSARDVFFGGPRSPEEQRSLEDRFFHCLRMPNWTHKETKAGRLLAFDDLILGAIPQGRPLRVLDVGVASGITTLDLANHLEGAGHEFHMVAVDQYLHAKLVRVASSMDVLFTSNNELLQVRLGGVVRSLPQGPVAWKRGIAQAALSTAGAVARLWPGKAESLNLVSMAVQERDDIEFVEQDIEQVRAEWNGQFDLVRAANILNLAYFPPPQLEAMVASLLGYLTKDGVFAVGRTDTDTNETNGSLFQFKEEGGLVEEVGTMGAGSEIAHIVKGHGAG